MLIAFNKPFAVLSQFTPDGSPNRTLADFALPPRIYPIGRLDADSEGLLLLGDEPEINARLLPPTCGHERTYWVQVEGIPREDALQRLRNGVMIQRRKTLPCKARILQPQPDISPRNPPIRFRKSIPTTWIELRLTEGKNRQVRRMTASVALPTLRLIRVAVGAFQLGGLAPGEWRKLTEEQRAAVFW